MGKGRGAQVPPLPAKQQLSGGLHGADDNLVIRPTEKLQAELTIWPAASEARTAAP